MIVVDASVLIAHLDSRDAFHRAALDSLRAAAGRQLHASALTVAEVLVGPARAGVLSVARRALDALRLETVGLGPDAPDRLAVLRAETGLTLPDCCVLLAAQDTHAEAVLTFDDRLRQAASAAGYAVSVR